MANSTSDAPASSQFLQASSETSNIPCNVTELVVIRHGETEWNASGIIQGHLDPELNELGRRQAVAIARRLSRESKISAIYSSDLKRAAETAKCISEKCGAVEVILDSGFKERHMGDLQGLVLRDAPKIVPKAYEALISSKSDRPIPGGGESVDQLRERCLPSLESIATKHLGQRVVVVSHGGVLREYFSGAAPKGARRGKILNVSHNIIYITDKMEWSIKSWGDVSHLQDVGFLANAFGGDKMSGLPLSVKRKVKLLGEFLERERERECLVPTSVVRCLE